MMAVRLELAALALVVMEQLPITTVLMHPTIVVVVAAVQEEVLLALQKVAATADQVWLSSRSPTHGRLTSHLALPNRQHHRVDLRSTL